MHCISNSEASHATNRDGSQAWDIQTPPRSEVKPERRMHRKSHGQVHTNLSIYLSPATHPSAQALDRPTATVSPLRTQTSPSRLPSTSLRPRSVASPQHGQQPPAQMCPRPAIPFTSAASAITPPNVSAANLSGEVGGTPISGLSTPSPINSGYKPDDKKNEKVSGPSWANPVPRAGKLLGPFHTVANAAEDRRGFSVLTDALRIAYAGLCWDNR